MEKMTSFPPGTGPFQFVEWQPRQRVVLQRNDQYWGPKAPLDKLVLRPVKEATVRFNALVAGDVDMTERVPYEWVKEITKGRTKGIRFAKANLAGLNALIFNVAGPPFNDRKLRLAVAHAIDRREILHAAFEGLGEPNDQKYPKGHTWYFEGLPWPPHNPEKARILLKEAGYQGQAIPIITSPEATDQTMAVTLQAQLKRVGVAVKLETLEVGAYNARQIKGEFAFRFRGGDFYPDPWTTYGRDLLCEEDLKKRVSNNSGFCDRETEALLKRAEIEVDPAKRREMFRRILWRVAEEVPEIFIGYVPRFFAYRDHVKGFSTDDAGRFRWSGGGLNTTWVDRR
jgi:peptide/nickel transport system substrate-binding protein